MKRTATANWQGTGKEGKGTLSTQSGVLNNQQYSYGSRFEEGIGTNPEELIGAAHAGCFSMKLSFILVAAGYTAESIDTKATVTLENGSITHVQLDVKAKVPGMDGEKFAAAAEEAKATCPISKSLNATITMNAVFSN
ncbi:MAG TPA: OsmC family protein [Bacteroidia bacterium]|nr:OsmC family protein [Bacteroidia bacterium]HRH07907.1 OsmC family protein [Bacteroidia bacterium]HRH62217.1 OsmC family protein [Bacteroidia bacterium]